MPALRTRHVRHCKPISVDYNLHQVFYACVQVLQATVAVKDDLGSPALLQMQTRAQLQSDVTE